MVAEERFNPGFNKKKLIEGENQFDLKINCYKLWGNGP